MGSLEGRDFCQVYDGGSFGIGQGTLHGHFGTGGAVLLLDDQPPSGPPSGARVTATGVLRLPPEGPCPGRHVCAGAGSSHAGGRFELRGLSDLGTCPGQPVAGSIDTCHGSDETLCPFGYSLAGSVAGTAWDWTDLWAGTSWIRDRADRTWISILLSNGGLVLIDLAGATVVGGFVWNVPEEQPRRAGYCIGGGILDGDLLSTWRITLANLSLLGECDTDAVEGWIDGS
jgi:hypothetical protein